MHITYDFKNEAQLLFWEAGTACFVVTPAGIVQRVIKHRSHRQRRLVPLYQHAHTHLADFGRSVRHGNLARGLGLSGRCAVVRTESSGN